MDPPGDQAPRGYSETLATGLPGPPRAARLATLNRSPTARARAGALVVGGRREPLLKGNNRRPYVGQSRGVWRDNRYRVRVATEARGGKA